MKKLRVEIDCLHKRRSFLWAAATADSNFMPFCQVAANTRMCQDGGAYPAPPLAP